jgi:hypothetical protein
LLLRKLVFKSYNALLTGSLRKAKSSCHLTLSSTLKIILVGRIYGCEKQKSGGNMIWAILPDVSKTESLLNNLSEADFNLDDISVMIQDINLRNRIAKDLGPLRGVELKDLENTLTGFGLSQETAVSCNQAVLNGKVLVVMKIEEKYRSAAVEMFQDHSAQLIKG